MEDFIEDVRFIPDETLMAVQGIVPTVHDMEEIGIPEALEVDDGCLIEC